MTRLYSDAKITLANCFWGNESIWLTLIFREDTEMKKTKNRLLQSTGLRLLRGVCAGAIAGVMLAVTAVPAMAAVTPTYPTDKGNCVININYKELNEKLTKVTARAYQVASVYSGEKGYVYQLTDEFADLKLNEDDANPVDVTEMVTALRDKSVDARKYLNAVYKKIPTIDDVSGIETTAVFDTSVDASATGVKLTVPEWGLYYVYSTVEKPNRYGVQPFLVTITEENLVDGVFSVVANPKTSASTNTTPGGGGGNPPPRGNTPPPTGNNPPPETPPSDGTVLGAARDLIPPQVLGANRLPQTGQLWWPVPILCIAGFVLIGSGIYRRKHVPAAVH